MKYLSPQPVHCFCGLLREINEGEMKTKVNIEEMDNGYLVTIDSWSKHEYVFEDFNKAIEKIREVFGKPE